MPKKYYLDDKMIELIGNVVKESFTDTDLYGKVINDLVAGYNISENGAGLICSACSAWILHNNVPVRNSLKNRMNEIIDKYQLD